MRVRRIGCPIIDWRTRYIESNNGNTDIYQHLEHLLHTYAMMMRERREHGF